MRHIKTFEQLNESVATAKDDNEVTKGAWTFKFKATDIEDEKVYGELSNNGQTDKGFIEYSDKAGFGWNFPKFNDDLPDFIDDDPDWDELTMEVSSYMDPENTRSK